MRTLRLYLGELDASEYIDVEVTEEQARLLIMYQVVGIDDGGILFTELLLDYRDE